LIGTQSHWIEEDYPKSVEHLEKAIKLAEETNNFISLIFANHFIGHVFADNCEFEKGLYHIKKGLEIVEMGNVLWSIAIHKACIALTIYCSQGKIDAAYQTGNEALGLAEESGDIFSKTEAFVNHGVCCYAKGFLNEAEKHLIMGKDFSERANLIAHEFMANLYLGVVYFLGGDRRRAQEYYNKALSYEKLGVLGSSWFNHLRLILTSAKVMANEKGIDLNLLYSYVSQNKIRRLEGSIRRHLSEILLNIDDDHLPEAEDWIKQAIEADKKNGVMFELGADHAVCAEIFKRMGDQSKAKENLSKAIEILKDCGADGWVEKYEKELATL
jgi:tetratricopeptide (TPR) repeat protein